MCVGNGRQNIPHFKGVGDFKGTIHHSDQHKDVKRWAGKKAVVVGAVSTIYGNRRIIPLFTRFIPAV